MIEHAELLELLDYNSDTGVFTNKVTRNSRAVKGARAGNLDSVNGYRTLNINKQKYREHRLAWFFVYGVWPAKEIDHINRVKYDNRIENLREATRSQNMLNTKLSKDSCTSKYRGVSKTSEGKWRALYCKKHLGLFDTEEEAYTRYKKEARFV